MDEMQQYELDLLLNFMPWADKVAYEQMRYQVWASLKPYLKKKSITPEELLPFYTDKTNEEREQPLPDAQVDAIREQIKKLYS